MSGAGGLRRLATGTPWSPRMGPEDALARGWSDLERARAAVRAEATDLAFTLAARVLAACATHERVVSVEGLRAALALEEPAVVRLARVHPTDLATCEDEVARTGASVRVIADHTLSPGDVVVEGRHGVIDARLRARLDALRLTLEQRS